MHITEHNVFLAWSKESFELVRAAGRRVIDAGPYNHPLQDGPTSAKYFAHLDGINHLSA